MQYSFCFLKKKIKVFFKKYKNIYFLFKLISFLVFLNNFNIMILKIIVNKFQAYHEKSTSPIMLETRGTGGATTPPTFQCFQRCVLNNP